MQKVTIKDIKTKSGTGGKSGKWTLVIITGDDGAEFTSFDQALEKVGVGAVIEIEPEIITKDGKTKVNIKEWTLVAPAPVAPPSSTSSSGDNMTKEEWAEKNRIERASIEVQVAFKGIVELASAHVGNTGGIGDEHLKRVYARALDWAMEKLGGVSVKANTPTPNPALQAPSSKSEADKDFDNLQSASEQKKEKSAPAVSIEERLTKAMVTGSYNMGQIKTHMLKKYKVTNLAQLNAAQFLELITDIEACQVSKQ